MNFKTTWVLALLLCALVLGYLVLQPRLESTQVDLPETPSYGESPIARDLVDEKLGDIVKVVCRRKGQEEWVFEKRETEAGAGDAWRMTSPLDLKVVSYEVDKFGRQLGSLTYEVSYKPGEPGGVSATDAGLDPPEAIVSLTDTEGAAVSVEIGKPASSNETYVRLAGSEEIVVGKADLRSLIKSKALEYRDQQAWTFDDTSVSRVEIDDRSDPQAPVSYAFVKDGARWMMQAPVTARATSKVDDMLRAMARLRTVKWHDDRPDRLAMYGLDPPALTIRATVEEEVIEDEEPSSEENEAEEEAALERESESPASPESAEEEGAPRTKLTVYELHLSDRSPIGEETKTYVRIGDEPIVGTLMKSTADKFKPVMSEWRDMHVTMVKATAATRIELATPQGSATLIKTLGRWSFDADGGPAEEPVVEELLISIADLTAVVFVDGEVTDLSALGLDEPQAEIRLTIPGVEDVERITVGGYTDAKAKRMVYVRRNEVASVAKVRAADVATLTQASWAYRDRTIVDVHPNRFQRIALSTENQFADGQLEVTFERDNDAWTMVAPVAASVRADRMDELVDQLSHLRAESIVAHPGEPGAFGLAAPAATIVLTYEVPSEDQTEPSAEASADESGDDAEAHVKPEVSSSVVSLSLTKHEGKFYAARSERKAVYQVTKGFYEALFGEFRSADVMDFDDSAVQRFSIRSGDETHVFARQEDRWSYRTEPDLPLDSKKVENLLLQIHDLKTERYVRHAVDDPSDYGLSSPLHEVIVTLEDGTDHVLRVSGKACDRAPKAGFYASVDGCSGVFLLTESAVRRFEVSLDELESGR